MKHRSSYILLSVIVLGVGIISLIFSLSFVVVKNGTYQEQAAVLKTLLAKEKTKQDISQTLQIAYNITSYSADGYAEVFYSISRKYVIDWEYFAALVYIESQYNQMAESPAGAKGLTQLLESTAEHMCNKMKIPYKKGFTIWNSFVNLNLGCEYFAQYKRNTSDMNRIIRHYNPAAKDADYLVPFLREYKKLSYVYKGLSQEIKP